MKRLRNKAKTYRMYYLRGLDERAWWEAEQRGWLGYVKVFASTGKKYEIEFIDPSRLEADLRNMMASGNPYWVADPSSIIVPQVTKDAMDKAFAYLSQTVDPVYGETYFDHIKPTNDVPRKNRTAKIYRLVYPENFDAEGEKTAEAQGILEHVTVLAFDKKEYEIAFCTPAYIEAALQAEMAAGRPCWAYPHMIVVPRVVRDEMDRAFEYLANAKEVFGGGYYIEQILPVKKHRRSMAKKDPT